MSTIFRLKFAFDDRNEEGKLKKAKLECLVECETYSEAEKMAYDIIEREGLGTYGDVEYEIAKTKLSISNFIDNNTLSANRGMVNGKTECYFSDETDAFFIVKMKLYSYNEKGKKQQTLLTCVVSDESINKAIATVRTYMSSAMQDYVITDTKMDAAEYLYLSPSSYKSIKERYEAKA